MKINKPPFGKALKTATLYFFVVGIIIVITGWYYAKPYHIPHKLVFIEISKEAFLLIATSIIIYFIIRSEIGQLLKNRRLLEDEVKKYQLLFENAHDAILIMQDFEIIEFNNHALQLFKCTQADFKGKVFITFVSNKQEGFEVNGFEAHQLLIKAVSETPHSIKLILKRCDDFPFYAEISFSTTEYGDKKITQAIVRDISDLKLSEQALQKSEKKHREIIQNANIAMMKVDLKGDVLFFNEYAQKLFGYTESEITGKNVIGTIFSEADLRNKKEKNITFNNWVQGLIANIELYQNVETWNIGKNGQKIYMEWSTVPTHNEELEFTGVLCFGTNRSDQKMTYNKLLESEQKFKLIFNAVSDGISFTTGNGELIEVNDVVLKQFGLTRSEFYAKEPVERWPVELKKILPEIIKQADKKDDISFEFEFNSDTGIPYQIEVSTKRILFDGQEGYIAVSREISERKLQLKRIYNAVIEAEEKERSRVARELHDGVAPILSTAKLYTQTLANCDPSLRTRILSKIEETINESIQSVSDISNNLSPHVLRNFGLEIAVNSFITRIADTKELIIQFTTNIKDRLPEILEITIYRIIIELLNNTIKHAQATTVKIGLKQNGKIFLTYTDNGKGIETEKFTSGMGLYNISIRVKSLNGKINMECNPEHGFQIDIIIPLNE